MNKYQDALELQQQLNHSEQWHLDMNMFWDSKQEIL